MHDEELATAYNFFLAHYREHKLDYTYAYPGVLDALAALRNVPDGRGRKMAVLTNKPVRPARAICDGLGMGEFFFQVYGGDSFALKKPDPLGLRTLMQEAGATPAETLMIGDSKVDVQTGAQCRRSCARLPFRLRPPEPDGDPARHRSGFSVGVGRGPGNRLNRSCAPFISALSR